VTFFALLREWAQTHRNGTVTTAGFEAMAQRFATRPVDDLLTRWLHEPPLPALPTTADS
jgi:hypothetical protein